MEFVYDRNLIDVQEAREYKTKILTSGFNSLTEEEKTAWLNGLKGCLNYTDLNRIEINCKTLSDIFNLELVTKIDWVVGDFPKQEDFERIKNNVQTLRDTKYIRSNTPYTPDIPLNRYDKINDIEKILLDVYEVYNSNLVNVIYMNDEIYINEQIGVI